MAADRCAAFVLQLLTLITYLLAVNAEVLTPPYFNLAFEREIVATSTCGHGPGVTEERYCKLTGADITGNEDPNVEIIQGQLCDVCVDENQAAINTRQRPKGNDPEFWTRRVHKAGFAVDGTERWWQSPPLSRGLQYNNVNLSIDLGQLFHVAYIFIKMGNSPRPGVFAVERSVDGGATWKPWQYFADTINDCYHFFGKERQFVTSLTKDDDVLCTTKYSSIVPLEGGEIALSLVNGRPNANNFSYSDVLQEWTKATNVRLRFVRTKTLLGHLMAVNVDQDPTVTRRYFYSVKDISIGGRCVCNGHADTCIKYDPTGQDPRKLVCSCSHNTCGDQCEVCCPNYVQKPWKPATPFSANECEPCQCHGHTSECVYDEDIARQRLSIDIHGNYEGGGRCMNCRHNTEGVNCENCVTGYYRPHGMPLDSPDVCQPCNCDLAFTTGDCEDGSGRCICRPEYAGPNCERCNVGYYGWPRCQPCDCNSNGTMNGVCEARGGVCPCKYNYDGQYCDQCAYGYYDFPYCRRCQCNGIGVIPEACDPSTGQCKCKMNYDGRDCDKCSTGHYNYPACSLCQCDPNGCVQDVCDAGTGVCLCKPNFAGARCDQCAQGYFRYPFCIDCDCNLDGSLDNYCSSNGQCRCKPNFTGQKCNKCAPGYYQYPTCQPCNCDSFGSFGKSCDHQTGACDCRQNFMGLNCNECRPNFYNYPACEECNCNPEGARPVPNYPLGGCGSVTKGVLCECKDRVQGRICDQCKPGYWNLDRFNPYGCDDCGCLRAGTTGGQNQCDRNSGWCICKTFTQSRRCDQCMDGMYNLQEYNHFGCKNCACVVGGSLDGKCQKWTGECTCRPRVTGRQCDQPISTHYFPLLHHHKYEMEEGKTVRGGPVRYGYNDQHFQDFSWRGYAILSRVQDEVVIEVDVTRTTLFQIVYRFVNRNPDTVTAEVSVKSPLSEEEQNPTVYFPSTGGKPAFVMAGTPVYLTSGRWLVSLKSPRTLFVDYMVLVPREYYEASVLQQPVNDVCLINVNNEPCKHYVYLDVSIHPAAQGTQGTVRIGYNQTRTQLYPNQDTVSKLGSSGMAYLNQNQREVSFSLPVLSPGKYYLIAQYHSTVEGRLQTADVQVASQGVRANGKLKLATCQYTAMCRQVVVDNNGDAMQFEIRDNYGSVQIAGNTDIDLAIDSVIAIPAAQWNLEMIQPRLSCIRRNGQCIQSHFINPTGSVQAQFEAGPNIVRIADDIPPNVMDTSVKVIKLDSLMPNVNVKVSVDQYQSHAFVIHYFQPYDVGFDVKVDVLVGPQINSGHFRADYCPSVSGCRSVVTFDNKAQHLELNELDVILAFNNSALKPVWLDYIMVVPVIGFFDDSVLEVRPIDKSAEFISQCASNNFYIDPQVTGFCRDGVFSLTTDYNNGALSCDCNNEGSTSFICEPFGGQCRCKDNVIGRTCTQCRTGYYGFPNCRECNCPSGLCDDRTGQCMCPPRVTGAKCDVCLPQTFGYDPLIGCEECNCDINGVRQRNLECDVNSGQCQCRNNIMGRRCDECQFGFHGFPSCRACNCDKAGTKPRICDPYNAQCICKDNVYGERCDSCNPGTYYLEERNPLGCAQCFCFGKTSQCSESRLRRKQVMAMLGWGITNIFQPQIRTQGNRIEVYVSDDSVYDSGVSNDVLYWIAPYDYLQNKVTAYGGQLRYKLKFDITEASDSIVVADVRLEGNNMTLTYIHHQQPEPGVELDVAVDLLETNFVHAYSGGPVTRTQFMTALANLDSLMIRASYNDKISYTSLADVTLDTAAPDGQGDVARNVEQCRCPPNYQGTSCERCASGYYRAKTGPYVGECIPCQCYGRSDTCDPETGVCLDCRDSFTGPQCIKCMRGHYEDPYTRRCEPCACPGDYGNNFASTCDVSANGVLKQCVCDRGYIGPNCGICDNGYYGDPRSPGGRCQPCQCNQNIDIRDRLSCDLITGACLRCINNSTGDRCERCLDWYWGDAINRKDCTRCTCNQVGSERCDQNNGVCMCKPNVIGPNCDQCAPNTFGFQSGSGCQRCDCAPAALGGSCDMQTGRCVCPPGVTGRRCDQCERGYFGYSAGGCQKCDCQSDGAVTCDAVTGQCQCLPGVTGPKCDQCLPRWALIQNQGCIECDQCVTILLDDVEGLTESLDQMSGELSSINVGQEAIRRLQAINSTCYVLRPQVENAVGRPTDNTILDPLKAELMSVKDLGAKVRDDGHRMAREAEVVQMDAKDARIAAENLRSSVNMAVDVANEAVTYAEGILQDILSSIRDQNVDGLLREAERILQEINSRDFSSEETSAENELNEAIEALRNAKELYNDAKEQANKTIMLTSNVRELNNKLQDLMNNSRHSIDNSQAAVAMNKRTAALMSNLQRMLAEIQTSAQDANQMEQMARDLLTQASQFLDTARVAFREIEKSLTRLDVAKEAIKREVVSMEQENQQLKPLVDRAVDHASDLQREADRLDDLLADTRSSAEGALNASRAYQAIVDAINNAMIAAESAINSSKQANQLSNGLAKQAEDSRAESNTLHASATSVKQRVQTQLTPRLNNAIIETDRIMNLNMQTEDQLNRLIAGMDMLPADGYEQEANEAATKAMAAEQLAKEASSRIQAVRDKLPQDRQKAQEIPAMIADVNKGIDDAKRQVEQVQNLVPQIDSLISKLGENSKLIVQIGEDLTREIELLRENIKLARGEAGRIELGVEFKDDVALQVRNPNNLADAGGYSQLSLYFRAPASTTDGFLAYIGPDLISRQQYNDYMSLEMEGGQIVFRYDLGEGPAEIRTAAADLYNDDKWHEVITERTGKTGTLIVRTQDQPDVVVTGASPGTKSVFDLDPDAVKFFIGGVPNSAGLQDRMNTLRFVGAIEDVKFDGVPVGLWDFVYGENNYNGVTPRDELTSVTTNGFRFQGDGYVILDKERFRPEKASRVEFDFKTYAEDGLMFLIGMEEGFTDFFSIDLVGGRVRFQYDLGSGIASMTSPEKYNDGKWHRISANRIQKNGLLKVDEQTVGSGASRGTQTMLDVNDNVYIGGYKGTHNFPGVTNEGFVGCIKLITLGSSDRNINDNKLALNVVPGCTEISRIVSFDGKNSFIAMEPVNVNSDFQMTMKMKSIEQNGLLFYVSDATPTQGNALSVSMKEGKLYLITAADATPVVLETEESGYNDGAWHFITVTKIGKSIQLDIDDKSMVTTKYEGKKRIETTSPLYFGGIPPGIIINPSNVNSIDNSLVGCIGDVTINGNFINFATAAPTNTRGVTLNNCPLPDPTPAPMPVPSQPTFPPPRPSGDPGTLTCALPLRPATSGAGDVTSGTQFGANGESRLEFDAVPGVIVDRSEFSLEFRTSSPNGVIFYVSEYQKDFMALYMLDGLVKYDFNCGSGIARISSVRRYDDGQWHKVSFVRDERRGNLIVDGADNQTATAEGNSRSLNVLGPFYVGGLPVDVAVAAADNLQDMTDFFTGCLKNLKLSGQSFGDPNKEVNTQPCTTTIEAGTYVGEGGGHVILEENFVVGLDREIYMEVRPRTLSGVLASVYSQQTGEYFVLQLVNGDVQFNVYNGVGEVGEGDELKTSFIPSPRNSLCDGKWHTIRAEKNKNVVRVRVDGVYSKVGVGVEGVSETNTNDPLYIGGVPVRHSGVRTTENYVGCIRNVQVDKKPYNLSAGTPVGNVNLNTCPTR